MEAIHYEISCPLCPLLPLGQGYPPGFELPPRMRPINCLDLPQLTKILKESLIYSDDSCDNVSVISALSPYTHMTHVLIMDLSPVHFLPAPEFFSPPLFEKVCKQVGRCTDFLRNKGSKCICAGYNWSPYSFGSNEEKIGAQSVITKFHFSVWEWDDLSVFDQNKIISEDTKRSLGENKYGLPFAHFIYEKIKTQIDKTGLFLPPLFSSRSLFLPFKENTRINDVIHSGHFIQDIARIISDIFSRLCKIVSNTDTNDLFLILKNTEKRTLTEEEISILRDFPKINSLDACLEKCENDWEKQFIANLHPSMINRMKGEGDVIWRKNFAYSLVLCESQKEHIESGLRIYCLPQCGPGGIVEALGCILTRPVTFVAPEEDMKYHNKLLWDLASYLRESNSF